MKTTGVLPLFLNGLVVAGLCSAQTDLPATFHLTAPAASVGTLPPSNSVAHMATRANLLWIASSKGLARTLSSGMAWERFRADSAFASDGIFSIAARGDTIWCSTGLEKEVGDGSVQTGTGYAVSTDNGRSWLPSRPQVLDARGNSIVSYGINDSLRMLRGGRPPREWLP